MVKSASSSREPKKKADVSQGKNLCLTKPAPSSRSRCLASPTPRFFSVVEREFLSFVFLPLFSSARVLSLSPRPCSGDLSCERSATRCRFWSLWSENRASLVNIPASQSQKSCCRRCRRGICVSKSLRKFCPWCITCSIM